MFIPLVERIDAPLSTHRLPPMEIEATKAVFLPDGTLFTHGGFPHTDVQKDIAALIRAIDVIIPACGKGNPTMSKSYIAK